MAETRHPCHLCEITELGEETLHKVDRLVIHTRKWAPDNYIAGFNDEKVEAHDPIDLVTEGAKGPNVAPKQPFWLGAPELKDVIAGKLRRWAKRSLMMQTRRG